MRVCVLGIGSWGFTLARLLAIKGYEVICWSTKPDLVKSLSNGGEHPKMAGYKAHPGMRFTTNMEEALIGVELIVESVTAKGVRSVFEQVKALGNPLAPIVITSKGIEQNSDKILCEVIIEVMGEQYRSLVGYLSGPSYAQEVIKGLPTAIVSSAYSQQTMTAICNAFSTPALRIYPNSDVMGVALGGALKNIIAIACGISDGLKMGDSARAALMTRGLHEISKLAVAMGCRIATLHGLSGLGDLCMTCSSSLSRNYRFGHLLSTGMKPQEAMDKIGMVVEGAYTAISALQLSRAMNIPMPITEGIYNVIYTEGVSISDGIEKLMQRTVKEEEYL
jgi:glycerol-3-phosphate dehydrogenase (NAD(P)+)